MDDMISHKRTDAHFPQYHISWWAWARLIGSALVLRQRSFSEDCLEVVSGIQPPLEVLGAEHIPSQGPCLVTCNHYHRPGFAAWWIAVGVSSTVAARRAPDANRDIHWLMTAAWTFPENRLRRILTPMTRWVFRRVARVYGFVPMPPMPPSRDEVEARARAVMQTLRLSRGLAKEGGMIAIAPEGQDTTPGELGTPPEGAGEFIALLVQTGMPVLPVGLWEVDGRLRVSFGPLFIPHIPSERAQRDKFVSEQVMGAIAKLLHPISLE
jgi:1-acyl-sn-glycerol-3-phosphate acyltransferase